MVDLVRASRAEVDDLLVSRVWNDIREKSEAALKRDSYSEAIQIAETIKKEYLFFQRDPKKVRTRAGVQQEKYLRQLVEETIPRAYLADREAMSKIKGIEAYTLISQMRTKYGKGKWAELRQLRTLRLANDLRALQNENKWEEASALLAQLKKNWTGDLDFQRPRPLEEGPFLS